MICYVNLLTGDLIEFPDAKSMIAFLVDKNIITPDGGLVNDSYQVPKL